MRAYRTTLLAQTLNGKNNAGTGIPQLFSFTQPLKSAQNDAFRPPTSVNRGPFRQERTY